MKYKSLVWSGTAALIFLSLFLAVNTKQTLETSTTTNTVSFSGEGKVLAKPDVAVIDLSIVTEATTSKAAQDQNSTKSKALTDFLTKQGIDEKDIKTTGYNIYPQYSYPQNGRPVITGYQVNQSVQVKVRDLEKVDTILDGVVSAGVNQINNLQLTIDDPEKLKEEAREQAIADAKSKASKLQKQLGVRLGRIVNFSENESGYFPPIYFKEGVGMGGGVPDRGPSIPTGENEILVNVSITYQIR
jgi:uncharacterized protein YggE